MNDPTTAPRITVTLDRELWNTIERLAACWGKTPESYLASMLTTSAESDLEVIGTGLRQDAESALQRIEAV